MPYYEVIQEGPFRGEREIVAMTHSRRVSFITPLVLGPRRFKLCGRRQLSIEVMNHDVAVATLVWGDFLPVYLKHHDPEGEAQNIDDQNVVDQPGIVEYRESEKGSMDIEEVEIVEGTPITLFRTSLFLNPKLDESCLFWSASLTSPDEDIFFNLALGVLSEQLGRN